MNGLLCTSAVTWTERAWSALGTLSYVHRCRWAARFPFLETTCTYDLNSDELPADRPPSWRKLPLLRDLFAAMVHAADGVGDPALLWLDGDCLPAPDARPSDFLPPPGQLRAAADVNGINCGVLAFPPEPWVPDFLADWYAAATPAEVIHPWWEQATLHRLVRADPAVNARIGPPIRMGAVVHAAGVPLAQKLTWLQSRLSPSVSVPVGPCPSSSPPSPGGSHAH